MCVLGLPKEATQSRINLRLLFVCNLALVRMTLANIYYHLFTPTILEAAVEWMLEITTVLPLF